MSTVTPATPQLSPWFVGAISLVVGIVGVFGWQHFESAPVVVMAPERTGEPGDLIQLDASASGYVRWQADKGVQVVSIPPGSPSASR